MLALPSSAAEREQRRNSISDVSCDKRTEIFKRVGDTLIRLHGICAYRPVEFRSPFLRRCRSDPRRKRTVRILNGIELDDALESLIALCRGSTDPIVDITITNRPPSNELRRSRSQRSCEPRGPIRLNVIRISQTYPRGTVCRRRWRGNAKVETSLSPFQASLVKKV